MELLSQLYRRFSERSSEEQVAYLPSYQDLTDDGASTIATADAIIEQRMDLAPRVETGDIVSHAERHFVPLLAGDFSGHSPASSIRSTKSRGSCQVAPMTLRWATVTSTD